VKKVQNLRKTTPVSRRLATDLFRIEYIFQFISTTKQGVSFTFFLRDSRRFYASDS